MVRRSEAKAEEPKEEDKQQELPRAPDDAQGASMGDWYDSIVTTITKIDPESEFAFLQKQLTLGTPGSQADRGVILDALEIAQDNARRAHALYVHSCIALEGAKLDAKTIESGIRSRAIKDLEAQKSDGKRSKINLDDIVDQMNLQYEDEMRALAEQKAKNDGTVDHIKWLADLWKSRIKTLETMAAGSRI